MPITSSNTASQEAGRLREIVDGYSVTLHLIPEEMLRLKPRPGKWSKKEILGHLVDSAQNNIRRFVVAQYEDVPFIAYRQDEWVTISDYQNYPSKDLIELWNLLNRHICQILLNISAECAQRRSATGGQQPHTIEWLAVDYIKHLLHHLHQVLDLEPVAYP
jgi:hypothetical protein